MDIIEYLNCKNNLEQAINSNRPISLLVNDLLNAGHIILDNPELSRDYGRTLAIEFRDLSKTYVDLLDHLVINNIKIN